MIETKKGKAHRNARNVRIRILNEVNGGVRALRARTRETLFYELAARKETNRELCSIINAGSAKIEKPVGEFRRGLYLHEDGGAAPISQLRRRNLLRRFFHRRRGEFVIRYERSKQDIFDAWELLDKTIELRQRLAAQDRRKRYK